MDFLKHIPTTVSEGTILASFDITNPYTNIPHTLGLEAVKHWVKRHSRCINEHFKTDFIIKATRLVLEENTFRFDNKIYQQKKGLAKGTKFAPSYANLVIGYLEGNLYKEVGKIFDPNFKEGNVKLYLDDYFIFWDGSKEDLPTFHNILNTLHPSIKLTTEKATMNYHS
ncbi:uncharacterized protein LOC115212125 [Octopus sinensis]|uniref:Uncharacterized protein LOC115212125 n=1 Tax=Octopus sinensis TaxID=2607531 RepID=A0A6P7SF94_9MOLL|nr:uncharacterized protein LOC115212125 [Octopus sinensis]